MTPVSHFAQYLLKLDPKSNPGRLTLYNYVKHLLEPELPFTPAVIQNFYARALQFDHWQNDYQNLSEAVRGDVHAYLKSTARGRDLEDWAKVRHDLQIVPIQLFQDLEELAELEHLDRQKSGDQIKLVRVAENQILVVLLLRTGGLEAKVYPGYALVTGAKLRLAAPVSHLHYGSDLELMPHVKQVLDGTLLTTHCFHVDSDGAHGLITRGCTFQKFETYIRAKLPETGDLFNGLKRVEHYYINPQTDPFYRGLITRLDRANRLLNEPTPDSLMAAEKALNLGRLYLKHTFPNDRLLTLLVTHLDYGVTQRRNENRQPDPGRDSFK
jgi:hypothetical protein